MAKVASARARAVSGWERAVRAADPQARITAAPATAAAGATTAHGGRRTANQPARPTPLQPSAASPAVTMGVAAQPWKFAASVGSNVTLAHAPLRTLPAARTAVTPSATRTSRRPITVRRAPVPATTATVPHRGRGVHRQRRAVRRPRPAPATSGSAGRAPPGRVERQVRQVLESGRLVGVAEPHRVAPVDTGAFPHGGGDPHHAVRLAGRRPLLEEGGQGIGVVGHPVRPPGERGGDGLRPVLADDGRTGPEVHHLSALVVGAVPLPDGRFTPVGNAVTFVGHGLADLGPALAVGGGGVAPVG